MEYLLHELKTKKRVVIFSGAGVSTSAGIPDYRSSNGLLAQGKTWRDVNINTARPTPAHYFAVLLDRIGILRRVYTQNIDGLYQKAGLSQEKIVEFHGSIELWKVTDFEEEFSQELLDFTGDDLNPSHEYPVDLVIVMGTSLLVQPFAFLPNMANKKCRRFYINNTFDPECLAQNRQIEGLYGNAHYGPVKIGKCNVVTRPTWYDSRTVKQGYHIEKWRQYLIQDTCDSVCREIVSEWGKENIWILTLAGMFY